MPWIVVGLVLAVFLVGSGKKKQDNEKADHYGAEGMCMGMCVGTAIGTALGNNTGIGISLGMLIGLAIGSCIKKESQDERDGKR